MSTTVLTRPPAPRAKVAPALRAARATELAPAPGSGPGSEWEPTAGASSGPGATATTSASASASATILTQAEAVVASLRTLSLDASTYRQLDDRSLLAMAQLAAEQQRISGVLGAILAGEIALRSALELGHSGLAQRTGFRTPEEMVRSTLGVPARDAYLAVRVGRVVHGESSGVDPWLAPVRDALRSGEISVAAADSISSGLAEHSSHVTETALLEATSRLRELATTLDADRLYRRAREARDDLDDVALAAAHATLQADASRAEREQAARDARALTFRRLPDGSGLLTWHLDPESAAACSALIDRATSPRRGGPRFTTSDARARARRITDDERSTPQLLSDVFLELLRHGAAADTTQLLGSGAPVVSVLVSHDALSNRTGRAHFAAQHGTPQLPTTIATAERLACAGDTVTITLDTHGQPLDVGREQRLYSRRQRLALAARDGGCRWPNCERPPSWSEAHHIRHWVRDAGRTDVADGILLCRHHHLLSHNNGWEIVREDADYWLVPPPDIDPQQQRIPLPTKSRALTDALTDHLPGG